MLVCILHGQCNLLVANALQELISLFRRSAIEILLGHPGTIDRPTEFRMGWQEIEYSIHGLRMKFRNFVWIISEADVQVFVGNNEHRPVSGRGEWRRNLLCSAS